jgi:hypothetical protein
MDLYRRSVLEGSSWNSSLIRGKHCSECGTPIDAAKIPVIRNARKWLVAFGIALAVGFGSIFGFFISAVAQPPEGLNNISIGSFSNGVGNEWTYTALYSTQTQTRDFVVNSEEDDTLEVYGSATSGTLSVVVTVEGEEPQFYTIYPTNPKIDVTTTIDTETQENSEIASEPVYYGTVSFIDQPVGTKIQVLVITDNCRDVDFSASLS